MLYYMFDSAWLPLLFLPPFCVFFPLSFFFLLLFCASLFLLFSFSRLLLLYSYHSPSCSHPSHFATALICSPTLIRYAAHNGSKKKQQNAAVLSPHTRVLAHARLASFCYFCSLYFAAAFLFFFSFLLLFFVYSPIHKYYPPFFGMLVCFDLNFCFRLPPILVTYCHACVKEEQKKGGVVEGREREEGETKREKAEKECSMHACLRVFTNVYVCSTSTQQMAGLSQN